jgi:hypothetical protein
MHAGSVLIRLKTSRDCGFGAKIVPLRKDLLHPVWPENLGITLPFYRPFAEAFEPDIPDIIQHLKLTQSIPQHSTLALIARIACNG